MTTNEFHRLVIVGAGLGGLTLARILQLHGLDAVIFEGDTSRDARNQGGTLDMHLESGQFALKEAGLEAEFLAIARPEGQRMRIADKAGAFLWDDDPGAESVGTGERPEVDRGALRDLLIDSIEPERIRWGHKVTRIEPLDNGRHAVHFENGKSITAGVLVGADGAWSRVRSLLSDAMPTYTGVSFVEIGIPNADQTHPEIAQLVGHGSMLALADNKGLLAQRNGDGRIRVYVALRVTEEALEQITTQLTDPAIAKQTLLAQFADWAPQLTALIDACDDSFIPRKINMLPIGLTWKSQPGMTLLGDAAHLMSPFAGEGANLAMLDAAEFASALLAAKDPRAGIQTYEARMFARGKAAAEESARNLDLCVSIDGAANLATQMAAYTID